MANRDLRRRDATAYEVTLGEFRHRDNTEGAAAEVDFVNGWTIVDGALFLNWSAAVKRIFLTELSERLPASRRNWPDVHFDMRAGIRQIARHAQFPEEGIVHPQAAPPISD